MTTQSIPQNLISISENVHQNKTALIKLEPVTTNQEVIIRPLPPEVEKLVRKYLSRY